MDIEEQGQVICYKNYMIDRNQPLGSGSYGRVYKATCDDLPCAAKVLHPTIINMLDPGSGRIMERFQKECAYLRSARHPNIVTFLGVHWDSKFQLPVLFMELLDESLTAMLERSLCPLAFHIQVDICHDIALALAYLHSNGIIHRDLSSNNVLVIAGRRAKVTDFGMVKLTGSTSATQRLTSVPGTLVYMPPEAFQEPPSYSMKLDCFSEGVLIIQVCTRCFPDPGPRVRQESSEKSATGSIDIPIVETTRRKNHIDQIDSSNPLRAIAIDCLHHVADRRPSASELCQRIVQVKKDSRYSKAVKSETARHTDKDKQIHELHQRCEQQEETIQNLQERSCELQKRLEDMTVSPPDPSANVILNWREDDSMICKPRFNMIRGATVVDESIAYFMNTNGEICSYNPSTNTWTDLPTCPLFGSSLAVVNDLVTAVGGEEKTSNYRPTTRIISLETKEGEMVWEEQTQYNPMPRPRSFAAVICTRNSLIVAGGKKGRHYGQTYVNSVEIMDTESGTWCSAARLPNPYSRMSATVCGNRIYMLGGFGLMGRVRSVVSCSIDALLQSQAWSNWIKSGLTFKPVWSLVAKLPRYHFATAISINDQLFALGGCSSKDEKSCTKCVHKYNINRNSWEYVCDMPRSVDRCLAAVLPPNKLIVVGGGIHSEDDQGSNDVNIANIWK